MHVIIKQKLQTIIIKAIFDDVVATTLSIIRALENTLRSSSRSSSRMFSYRGVEYSTNAAVRG